MQRGSRLHRLAAALCWYRPRRLSVGFDDDDGGDGDDEDLLEAVDLAAGADRGQGEADATAGVG